MKKNQLCLLFVFVSFFITAQSNHNFDFEILDGDKSKDWTFFGDGNHKIDFDKIIAKNGSISGSIKSTNNGNGFKALSYSIPADFGGKKIKLSGYLKVENVNGWAGLWLRIDPNVGFDNMQSKKIDGTNDWKKYEIELDYNNKAKTIVFGGLLVGSGKIWVDNFTITVDGKPLSEAPERELSKAQKDKEFDAGSDISITDLNDSKIKDLTLLGQIWGFLKYYHPEIGKGNYNWDYELFRMLPAYLNSKSNSERNSVLLAWINKYGDIKPCKSCKDIAEDAFLKPDFSWMADKSISRELQEKLQYIQKNRHQGTHYYIEMSPYVGNPDFVSEEQYADMPYPDDGFRLLSVYRYWNMINYFFPYKHLMDKDWNSCLSEYIPEFLNAKNELEYELAALKMIGDIKDTHANLWGGNNKIQEQRGEFRSPVHVKFVEDQLIVDALFEDEKSKNSGLNVGDIITHINDKSVDDIVKDIYDFYPASNQPTRLRDISFDILRSTQNTSDLKIISNGKPKHITLNLYNPKDIEGYYRWYKRESEGKSYKMLDNNIGYITLKNIKQEDVDEIRKVFKDTKGIIIDIRNYPSAFMPFNLGTFLTSKSSEFVKFTNGSVDYPGEFTFGKTLSVPSKGKTYKGKVIVLVNEISQSQAEYTTMAFRAGDNVTVVGSTTAGADGNVSTIFLPGGLRTMISGIGVYYPDGTETQRVGIVPDIEVKPTIEGVKNGRDELMEKAIDIINTDIQKTKNIKD
ncbi:S41 family peptidase [Winogradskyella sp.]|uniref:S41 family peptidase n=1 Tax=Winogradskyella sp. TaxID=1883156 RepID=UPI002636D6C0|nr:S41 family peptidase [Winogradskyella sp.]